MPEFTRTAANAAAALTPPHGLLALVLTDPPPAVQERLAGRVGTAVPLAALPDLDPSVWRRLYRDYGAATPYATALACRPLGDDDFTWLVSQGEWRDAVWRAHLSRAGADPDRRQALSGLTSARSGGLAQGTIDSAPSPADAAADFARQVTDHGPPTDADRQAWDVADQALGTLFGQPSGMFADGGLFARALADAARPLPDPAFTDLHAIARPWQALSRPVTPFDTSAVEALRGRATGFSRSVAGLLGDDHDRWERWASLLEVHGSLFAGPGATTPLALARHAAAGTAPAAVPPAVPAVHVRRQAPAPTSYQQALAWAVDVADQAHHADFHGDGELLAGWAVLTRDSDPVAEHDAVLHDTAAHAAYRQLAAVHGPAFTVDHHGRIESG